MPKANRKPTSLEDQVYSILEEEILTGTLTRGTPLRELTISRDLRVSRTPVRSALRRLYEEELVELLPNRSAVVCGVSYTDVVAIFEIRIRLEGLAARYAALYMTEAERRALAEEMKATEDYLAKDDAERLQSLDDTFHAKLYRACGSRFLEKILRDLHRHLERYRLIAMQQPARRRASVEEHRAITEAIMRGDAGAAEETSRRHAEAALACILASVSTDGSEPETPVTPKKGRKKRPVIRKRQE